MYEGDLALEREHFKFYRELELEQVYDIFADLGFDGTRAPSLRSHCIARRGCQTNPRLPVRVQVNC